MEKRLLCFSLVFLGACTASTDEIQRQETERIVREGQQQVQLPAIRNYSEKRMVKDLYELRDQQVTTYTYLYSDLNACVRFFSMSVGYGLPYATQFTNPERPGTSGNLPQPEPNGLFMPNSAEASWVISAQKNAKGVGATYIEPRVIISPTKLPASLECDSVTKR